MRLNEVFGSRANNFNLLRLIAASLVLGTHSFTVVTGDADNEPLRLSLGITWGAIAVDIFFVVSGLLVTSSMRRSDSAIDYSVARALRILPGLFAALVVTGLVASAMFYRTLDVTELVWYVFRNTFPFGEMPDRIAGIFVGNPAGPGFNASLWTLPVELRMYRNVLLIWLLSFLLLKRRRLAFDCMIVAAAAYFLARHLAFPSYATIEASPSRLQMMFFVGAAALVLARYIRLSWIAVGAVVAAIVAASLQRSAFYVVYSLGLWYVVLCLAYLPRGKVLSFNRLGDYSYGVYIYAWPVQQMVISVWPGIGVAAHIVVSAVIVLGLSVVSWHVVESPALQLKKRWIGRKHRVDVSEVARTA